MTTENTPHYLGHRKRVKEKFLKSKLDSFADYELLEILLFSTHPRKDTKELAKKLIHKFGNINEIINAKRDLLEDNQDINHSTLILLKVIKEIIDRNFLQNIENKNLIDNWDSLLKYCQVKFSGLKTEEFRILFLNKKHQLLEDYCHNEGSIDNVQIDIEKIVKKTILLSAKSLIAIHNHPTCDIKPSRNDISTTAKLERSLNAINVQLHDHLIMGANNEYYSFKENGLI